MAKVLWHPKSEPLVFEEIAEFPDEAKQQIMELLRRVKVEEKEANKQ